MELAKSCCSGFLSSFAGVRCEANRDEFVTSCILDKLEMVIKVGEREDVIRVCRI